MKTSEQIEKFIEAEIKNITHERNVYDKDKHKELLRAELALVRVLKFIHEE